MFQIIQKGAFTEIVVKDGIEDEIEALRLANSLNDKPVNGVLNIVRPVEEDPEAEALKRVSAVKAPQHDDEPGWADVR